MATPTHPSSTYHAAQPQRYRRSSFNGAKQLKATQKPQQRVLLAVGALVLALLAAVGTIAFHLVGGQ